MILGAAMLSGATATASMASAFSSFDAGAVLDDAAGRKGAAALLSADAALIALCQAHPGLVDALNSDDRDCDNSNPHWVAYEASRNAISAARPQTIAGMQAKALAAKREARNPDGSESHENCMAADWSWDILHDVLRLAGGAA